MPFAYMYTTRELISAAHNMQKNYLSSLMPRRDLPPDPYVPTSAILKSQSAAARCAATSLRQYFYIHVRHHRLVTRQNLFPKEKSVDEKIREKNQVG